MIRVQDIDVTKSMGERMMGIGDITISGADASNPTVVLRNIRKPDEVYELLRKAASCQYTVVISDWLGSEIRRQGCAEEFAATVAWLHSAKKICIVRTTDALESQAQQDAHWQDELHLLLAKKGKAEFLVTRNVRDFRDDKISVVYPEQL